MVSHKPAISNSKQNKIQNGNCRRLIPDSVETAHRMLMDLDFETREEMVNKIMEAGITTIEEDPDAVISIIMGEETINPMEDFRKRDYILTQIKALMEENVEIKDRINSGEEIFRLEDSTIELENTLNKLKKEYNEKHNIRNKEFVIGGKADYITEQELRDSLRKKGLSAQEIDYEFEKGKEVEMEHTKNPEISAEITRDHIAEAIEWDDPRYYKALIGMEHKMEKGYSDKPMEEPLDDEEELERIWFNGKKHRSTSVRSSTDVRKSSNPTRYLNGSKNTQNIQGLRPRIEPEPNPEKIEKMVERQNKMYFKQKKEKN